MTMNPTEATARNARHGLNPPHNEVVEACQTVPAGTVLDMGCGSGRNALYLAALGFDVTAVDVNPAGIAKLQAIMAEEHVANIAPQVYDINTANLAAQYDFIACTVTLMFLDPTRVGAVLADMRHCTNPGGYNLIVCAMDTPAHPCPVNFPFLLHAGELSTAYKGWDLVKYNEDLGTLHSGARFQFATMLARKPA